MQASHGENSEFFHRLAIPETRPEVPAAVVILGDTAPRADSLHDAIAADALEAVRQALSKLLQDGVVFPDVGQPVFSGVAEDKPRHRLADPANAQQ